MAEIRCRIESIKKGIDGRVRVYLSYPLALNQAEFVFDLLPQEIGIEWFRTTPKDVMDEMRGAPK